MSWRILIRYLCVPAIALFITFKIYIWANHLLISKFGPEHEVKSSGEALIGGSFVLVNQDSKMVADSDFKGKLMLVYFGFTNCPDVCPTDLALITNVMNELGDNAKNVQPIFISIDPKRDIPVQLKKFLSNFYPGIIGLTGTPGQIETLVSKYKIFAKKVTAENTNNEKADYTMDHSSYIYLMGKDGKYLTHFNDKQTAEEITAKIKENL